MQHEAVMKPQLLLFVSASTFLRLYLYDLSCNKCYDESSYVANASRNSTVNGQPSE